MKSGMTDAHASSILSREFGAEGYTPPATWYIGVSTSQILQDGTGATEPSDGMYERVAVPNNGTNWITSVNGRGRENALLIEFPRATTDWGTIVSAALYAAPTGGSPLYFADLERSKIVQFNDSLLIESSELQIDISPLVL
jgi:hypothetical protein